MISGKDPLVRSIKKKNNNNGGRKVDLDIYLFIMGGGRKRLNFIYFEFFLFIFVEGSFKWKGNFEKV